MNWKCKIGWHDWETISCKSHSTIRNELLRTIHKPFKGISIERYPDKYYSKKICLRCEKYIDEITPHRKRVEEDHYRKENRRLRVKLLRDKL